MNNALVFVLVSNTKSIKDLYPLKLNSIKVNIDVGPVNIVDIFKVEAIIIIILTKIQDILVLNV